MSALELHHVEVQLGRAEIVRGVSASVEHGEWVALIGPNGAGKTTMLRAVAGLVPFDGAIAVDGMPVSAATRRELARRIALVPQIPHIPEELTVAEYVLLGRTPYIPYLAMEGGSDRRAAAEALERLGLRPFAERRLGSLSGGELQRVVLARALAQEAPLLLLDEPTSALDLGRQQQVLELVDELRRNGGLTVLSTMHDLSLAGQYADRLLLLDAGRIEAAGSPVEVLSEATLAAYYGASVRIVRENGHVFVLPRRRELA
ncbi:MAG: ABC transporter ATP-binding protein [Actinobacteria bacterium]|nr:MAG: ABC transporter ATP-binding protein [Actinomycetota bacterium]